MRVTYDPRLMALIREARALSGEGVELPREIRELVDRAASLAGRARALQQVATFHNTIGDRMVPSQRPLMLTVALELARAVQEQSGVVWSDPHLVDVYTARLKDLVSENIFAHKADSLLVGRRLDGNFYLTNVIFIRHNEYSRNAKQRCQREGEELLNFNFKIQVIQLELIQLPRFVTREIVGLRLPITRL